MGQIFKAQILTPKNQKTVLFYDPGYLVVSDEGKIEFVGTKNPRQKYKNYRFHDHSDLIICPGFIDTHNHLPQYAFAGIGDFSLLPWLKKYTFPRETQFKSEKTARPAANNFFTSLLKNGTTTTLTYVTTHFSATNIAFEEAKKAKIRAIIGKVMMDSFSPSALQEKTEKSLQDSLELIEKWHGHDRRLFYALTPRFALTCSSKLLEKIATLAKEKDVYIQTHLSENLEELKLVKKRFPKAKSYTDVYYRAGLLTPKTILAHCIHLSNPELTLIKKAGASISHCPSSNRFLMSGQMPARKYLTASTQLSLGTDVAGGYSLSMFNEMREALETSKSYINPLKPEEVFYMATLGGAKALSMHKITGSLEPGKEADFLIIDPLKFTPDPNTKYQNPTQILSQMIYRGSEFAIKNVFIAGKKLN